MRDYGVLIGVPGLLMVVLGRRWPAVVSLGLVIAVYLCLRVARVIRDQQREIIQMTNWRRDWFGSDQTPPMSKMPMVPGMDGEHAGHGGAEGLGDLNGERSDST